jgi:hypothetical protein
LRHCRKQLAELDFEFNQLLPKYHNLLLTQNETLGAHGQS